MIQVNVHEAESQLSRLLELVESGETVVIARHGKPVATLVRAHPKSKFPIGIAKGETLAEPSDEWWRPMTDKEAEKWIDGK